MLNQGSNQSKNASRIEKNLNKFFEKLRKFKQTQFTDPVEELILKKYKIQDEGQHVDKPTKIYGYVNS